MGNGRVVGMSIGEKRAKPRRENKFKKDTERRESYFCTFESGDEQDKLA